MNQQNKNRKKYVDMESDILEFGFERCTKNIIKVIGVGGGGGNAVNHMHREGIHDVSFALCNTDAQALEKSSIDRKVQLGRKLTGGLGAGNRPEIAQKAAEETEEDIKLLLSDGTKMAFVTAGMGGGTGTGAGPVVAKISKGIGILTVGIVTLPFLFEGKKKIIQALKGVEQMAKNVDAILVINNERLRDNFGTLSMPEAFAKADDTLAVAAKGIAEIITVHGVINLDFADVQTVLKDGGVAIMSTGEGEGENRLEKAILAALNSPLLNNNDVFQAKKILFNIYSSSNSPLLIDETEAINDFTQKFGPEIEVIWGQAIDDTLGEKVKLTLLASGFGVDNIPGMEELRKILSEEEMEEEEKRQREQEEEERKYNTLIEEYYGANTGFELGANFFSPKPQILTEEQMNDDRIIEGLENNPVYMRDNTFDLENFKKGTKKEQKDLFNQ